MVQTKKRVVSIDAAKAICVLLVIYGHTFRESMREAYTWCNLSYIFVYRFHVSTLFLLSGMGYTLTAQKNRGLSAGQYLRKKAHSLLLPWISYSALIYLVFALVQIFPPVRALLAGTSYQLVSPVQYVWLLLRNENPYSFHLWYLQTLFLFTVVTALLEHVLPPKTARRVLLALLILLPGFYQLFCRTWVWTFKGFFQQYAFFLLGVLLPREKAEQHARALLLLGLVCGPYVLRELFFPQLLLSEGFLDTYLHYGTIAGLGLGIWAACVLLQEHLQRLARFGQNSMLFYLYHQPFCCALVGMLLYDKLHFSAVGTVLVCMVVSLVVPYLIHKLAGLLHLRPVLQRLGLPG